MDEDFLLAVQLQEQFDYEASSSVWGDDINYEQSNKKRKLEVNSAIVPYSAPPEKPLSVVDESWEMLDPSPDVRAMFLDFNDKFFWGKLGGVEVKWSPRMTLCAGVCSYEGRGGLCSIRLSEPLLKLRPRKDLVQTLLHEMIHALLFVTQNNRDRDGHGPEFCKHMNRINQASGSKITVYHTFHDEVDLYRQHWWRCNGPCQKRKPFFGYVKRAMNRPPSALDPWWAEHQRSCGGTYVKIKEPENYGKKHKKGENQDKRAPAQPKGKNSPSSTITGKSGGQDIRNVLPFSGRGFVLGGSSQLSSPKKPTEPHNGRLPGEPLDSWNILRSPPTTTVPRDAKVSPQSSPSTASSQFTGSSSFGKYQDAAKSHPSGKKSVSNTKAFINVNGSPVRISATGSHETKPLNSQTDISRAKQKSFDELFHNKGAKSLLRSGVSSSRASKLSSETTRLSDVSNGRILEDTLTSKSFTHSAVEGTSSNVKKPIIPVSTPSGSSRSGPSGSCLNSKHLKSPEKSGSTVPVSRKRPWDGHLSPHIFDFFQRTSGGSDLRRTAEKLPACVTPPSTLPGPDGASSLTVSCPVCQITILESKINDHLDSCLAP
ncbi:DNA-dependent metalloprotease SPRTN [Brienomyrus brachyistius]|uniref:DNA-dependent metalloprotease SPRTN n=1 Tax=Brienomyrus brachyistius TaxID=42636 RepID=UPI0020B3813D|nr:DNA-dependent metalloprotease SPRTN [Brienomyrus brachyistius]